MTRIRIVVSAAALIGSLTLSSCGVFSDDARETITHIVTEQPTQTHSTDSPPDPVTVVNPSAVTSSSDPTSDTAADTVETGVDVPESDLPDNDESGPGTDGADGGEDQTTTSETTATTLDKAARRATRVIATTCDAALFRSNISDVFGEAVSTDMIRVADVANPDTGMTGRSKCYYGTDDLAEVRPLVLALAAFASVDQAERQVKITTGSEAANGAKMSTAEVDGHEAHIMVRDGGFIMVQIDAATVSLAIDDGLLPDDKLPGALTSLLGNVLGHLN